MLLGVLARNELIILLGFVIVVVLVVRFIFRYGKQKGRLEELEKRMKNSSKND